MANYNPETGIAYGVIQANDCPYLYDEILMNGTDNAYAAAIADIVDHIDDLREEYGCDSDDSDDVFDAENAFIKAVNDYIDDQHWAGERLHVDDVDFDAEGLAGELLECWDYDGHDVSYSCDGFEFELSTLGGAGIIFVTKSPFVASCKQCSPCVPGAGDLNNITGPDDGILAYCVDPADINPDCDDCEVYDVCDDRDDYKLVSKKRLHSA